MLTGSVNLMAGNVILRHKASSSNNIPVHQLLYRPSFEFRSGRGGTKPGVAKADAIQHPGGRPGSVQITTGHVGRDPILDGISFMQTAYYYTLCEEH